MSKLTLGTDSPPENVLRESLCFCWFLILHKCVTALKMKSVLFCRTPVSLDANVLCREIRSISLHREPTPPLQQHLTHHCLLHRFTPRNNF